MPANSNKQMPSNPKHYKPCYNCGKIDYTIVKSAWWGGSLGPQLLHHVNCNNCSTTYNGKTGQSNKKSIVQYVAAIIIVAMLLLYGFSLLGLL